MQTIVPLYGFGGGGGGGTGATLTVTAPSGCTVTISKDGKTKTKTAGTDGVAVFRGLATGQWTVTITDGEQTAQKTVTITADYSTAITFFSATIHVTYPAGSTCTATDGVTTLTAPDTSGTWDCVVPNAGTWTVACTNGTKTTEETVTITENSQSVSLELSYVRYMVKDGVLKVTFSTYTDQVDNDVFTVTQGDGYASFKGSAGGFHTACVAIDLTQYSTLALTGTKNVESKNSYAFKIGTWQASTGGPKYNNMKASANYSSGTNTTTLDVSSLSGVYLVGLTSIYTYEQKITDFHLE